MQQRSEVALGIAVANGPVHSTTAESIRPTARAGDVGVRALAIGMAVFIAVWLLHLQSTSLVPPADNLEQLTWVRSLEWGYYKHPPLPTWLLWLPVQLLGWSAWTVSLAGAVTTGASLALMAWLVARLRGQRHALVALLAAACITYYNGRLNYYNHNVLLMLFSTGCAVFVWLAFARQQMRWWLALGVCLGLGALTKYQIVISFISVLAFAVQQRFWRQDLHRQGLLLASMIALLIFTPHLQWLRSHDFGPITYAMSTSLGAAQSLSQRSAQSLQWLTDQLLNRALPAFVLLAWVAWALRRRAEPVAEKADVARGQPGARALLISFGILPLAFMVGLGLFTGADLQPHWGTAFVLFTVPAVMELTPGIGWHRIDLRRLLKAFVAIQLLLLLISQLTSSHGPQALRNQHWRTFDPKPAAAALAPVRLMLGGSIQVLSGPAAMAAAIALELPEQPLVLIDGRRDVSPWITDELTRACGIVEIGPSAQMPNWPNRPDRLNRPNWPDSVSFGAALPGWSYRVIAADEGSDLDCGDDNDAQ